MKTESMHVIIDMNAYCVSKGISKQKIADELHKDITVVKKQLSDRTGNIYINTAYEYAECLGGAIMFLTDEDIEFLAQKDELKNIIKDLEQHLEEYKSKNIILDQQITTLTKTLSAGESTISKLQASVAEKDEAIKRKDLMISKLLNRYVVNEI